MKNQAPKIESEPRPNAEPPVPIPQPKSELPDRLRLVIGDEPVTTFGRRCGIGEATLRKYFKGTLPNIDNLVAMADAANVSIEWLATGRGPRQRGTVPPAPAAPSAQLQDLQRLQLAIEAVQEGLSTSRRTLDPTRYAQLVVAVYGLLADAGQKHNVLKLIQLAA